MGKFSDKDPLGSDNNGDLKEKKTRSYEDFILSSNELYLRSDGLSTTH